MNECAPTVFFRCDGNSIIGLGHLSRCLKIAEIFTSLNLQSVFLITTSSSKIFKRLAKNQIIESINDPATEKDDAIKTLEILETFNSPKILIVDSYQLSKHWQELIMNHDVFLVAIDDFLRCHSADTLAYPNVGQNFKGRKEGILKAYLRPRQARSLIRGNDRYLHIWGTQQAADLGSAQRAHAIPP